jgi:hypothetical protein
VLNFSGLLITSGFVSTFSSSFQACFSATMCTVFGILFMVASVLGEGEAWPPWFEQAIWKINNYLLY